MAIFGSFMAAYSAALSVRVTPLDGGERSFVNFQILLLPPSTICAMC